MTKVSRLVTGFLLLWIAALAFGQTDVLPVHTEPTFVPNNRWALVIGVSQYAETVGPLRYTAKEAHEFSRTLTQDLAFAPENVRLLADNGESAEPPTSSNILGALDALLANKRLDKANLFVFYFSGHGVATPKGDFLLPADVQKGEFEQKGVPVREVIHRIVDAGLKNVLFIADACRAGTENDFGEDLSLLCRKANIAVILGCAPGKRSYEYPDLKQGAFTHFLLEGLKRPELRDASGALWASKLGADLQTRVKDFTEPDHGKYAQVPALWGEQSTLDVLLAAYPKAPVTDEAVKLFRSKAQTLDKSEYAAALISYAMALYEQDRTDETVDLLKTVEALGELTPSARFTMAVALDTLGRTGEAQRVYTSFLALPPSLYRNLAIASSTARSLDPGLRLKAATELFESDDTWPIKLLAFSTIENWGSYEQKLHYARLLATSDPVSARRRFYGEAQVAYLEGRWGDSIKGYETALQSPGDSPSDRVIFSKKLFPTLSSADRDALAKYYDSPEAKGFDPGPAFLMKAEIARQNGDVQGRIDNIRKALAVDISPMLLLRAARIAGVYIGVLKEDFRTAAARHPYSWRARIISYLISSIEKDQKAMEREGQAVDRYMDDQLTVFAAYFEFQDAFTTEAVLLNRLDPAVYRSQLDFFFLNLRDFADRFGYDPDLWMQFAKYGMFNERNGQVQQVVASHLKFAPANTPKALRPMMFLLALNRGDTAAVQQMYDGKFEPTERSDPAWFYAMFLATQGRAPEAAQVVAKLPKPSSEIDEATEALKTYLLAVQGKKEEARKRLSTVSETPVVLALQGLSWAAMGDWERAEPLLEKQTLYVTWTFLFLQEYATRQLDARYRATGRLAKARDLASMASISQPSNPLYERYSYNAKPGIAQFAGTTVLHGETLDDKDPNLTGEIRFTVSATGTFTGTFKPTQGVSAQLKGTTDANGNVRGTATWHGKRYSLAGKIAPAGLYKTYPRFHSVGQVFQMIDAEGFRVALIGKS